MNHFQKINGEIVPMTAEQVASREAEEAAWEVEKAQLFRAELDAKILTRRQLRLQLLDINITRSMIESALAGNEAGLIEWEDALEIRRDHPLVKQLAQVFKVTDEQLDTLWIAGEEL